MQIRLGEEKDTKAIAEIIKRHHQTDYMGWATFNDTYIRDKMKKNNFFFVAINNSIIVGCLRASVVDVDLAEIRTLCVDEKHRGKGIAKKLLETALEFLKEKKMRKVLARTKADNLGAVELFKKFGFEQEGYFKEHYRKNVDVMQLYKFL